MHNTKSHLTHATRRNKLIHIAVKTRFTLVSTRIYFIYLKLHYLLWTQFTLCGDPPRWSCVQLRLTTCCQQNRPALFTPRHISCVCMRCMPTLCVTVAKGLYHCGRAGNIPSLNRYVRIDTACVRLWGNQNQLFLSSELGCFCARRRRF